MNDYMVQLVKLLTVALNDPFRRQEAIRSFQETVWKGVPGDIPESLAEFVRDLAHDLDFYESSSTRRAEDDTFYGSRRLEVELSQAIARIERTTI